MTYDDVRRAVTRVVDVDGVPIRVSVSGEGPPLLLVNGLGGSLEMWQPFVSQLRGRQLITFDCPGTGESPRLRRPARMRRLAALVSRLLEELEVYRADVL